MESFKDYTDKHLIQQRQEFSNEFGDRVIIDVRTRQSKGFMTYAVGFKKFKTVRETQYTEKEIKVLYDLLGKMLIVNRGKVA